MAIGEVNPWALPMGVPGSAPAGGMRTPTPVLAWPGGPRPLGQPARLPTRAGNNAKAQPLRTGYGASSCCSWNRETAAPRRSRTRW